MVVGVIGSGAISDIYLKNMIGRFENLTVKAVASKHPENAKKKADQYGLAACTVEELLADPEIQMVVVLTPVGTHYELIKQALLAGKHVYTEKTITDAPEKAKELLELADEKGLMLGSAPDTFMGAAWQNAREIIDSGKIGEINSFVLSANRNNDILLSLFSFLREPGCGILYDYAVYYMTCLCALLGPVDSVCGITRTPYPVHKNIIPGHPLFGQDMDTPNESQVSAIIRMENGITGTLNINSDSVMADQAYFMIYGTKGILYLTDPNGFGGEVKIQMNPANPRQKPEMQTVYNYFNYGDNSRGIGPADLAEAIEKGTVNRASKEMAYHVLEVLTVVLDSSKQGGAMIPIASTMQKPAPLTRERITVKNLGHTSFNMKNEKEMIHFYRDILGMKEQFTLTLRPLVELFLKEAEKKELTVEEKAELDAMAAVQDQPWITYFKLADGQFIELFYDQGRNPRVIADRRKIYGYTKLNYEVDDVLALKEHLLANGIALKDDYHPTADGSFEIAVLDPDGNEVQFTQYGPNAKILPHAPEYEGHTQYSPWAKYTTQVAFDVKDEINMPAFYEKGLGLRKALTLYVGDLIPMMEAGGMDPKQLMGMKMIADKPWIDYFEVGPHQYLELFYSLSGEPKTEDRKLGDSYGYQHLCLEVEDIHRAYAIVTANGIRPDTEIQLGGDGAYQLWLTDPDGNRLELMDYAGQAMQLK